MTDKRIAVLSGGVSSERDISLRSAEAIVGALLEAGYTAYNVEADRDVAENLNNIAPDVVFIALHGGVGENGCIQGLLECMGFPYTGSGVLASAIAMDKLVSKQMFIAAGLDVPQFIEIGTNNCHLTDIPWPAPWVVKPTREGSSVGVSIVNVPDELDVAIERAKRFDGSVLIEKYITGKEIHVGIVDGSVLGAVEIRPSNGFYDYKAKYTKGLTSYICPPEIDDPALKALSASALKAYQKIDCRGAARVDMILSLDEGIPYILEINTLPGMTATSLLPMIARHAGYSFVELVERMLIDALSRSDARKTEGIGIV